MAACRDIHLRRNEALKENWAIVTDDGPIDLTGCMIAGHVRSTLDNTVLIEAFVIEVTDAVNGELTLTLDASEGSALSAYGNPIQVACLPYDIRLTYPDNLPIVLVAGRIILSRGTTHS